MPGTVLASGQRWIGNQLMAYQGGSGLYVALIQNNSTIPETAQIGSGITEVVGSGYTRKRVMGWAQVGTLAQDSVLQGSGVTFNVLGTWSGVNGYCITDGLAGGALWAELLPLAYRGDKNNGDAVSITPIHNIKDISEI